MPNKLPEYRPRNRLGRLADEFQQSLDRPLPMEGRYNLLPLRQTNWPLMGQNEWAVPGVLAGMWNAFTAPGRAAAGKMAEEQIPREALNFAGNVSLDSYALSRAMGRNAIPDADQRSVDVGVNIGGKSTVMDDHATLFRGGTPDGRYWTDSQDVAASYGYPAARGESVPVYSAKVDTSKAVPIERIHRFLRNEIEGFDGLLEDYGGDLIAALGADDVLSINGKLDTLSTKLRDGGFDLISFDEDGATTYLDLTGATKGERISAPPDVD